MNGTVTLQRSKIMDRQGLRDILAAGACLYHLVIEIYQIAKDELDSAGAPLRFYAPETIAFYNAVRAQVERHGEVGIADIVPGWGACFVGAMAYLFDGAPYAECRDLILFHVFLQRGVDWQGEAPTLNVEGIKCWLDEVRLKKGLSPRPEADFMALVREHSCQDR